MTRGTISYTAADASKAIAGLGIPDEAAEAVATQAELDSLTSALASHAANPLAAAVHVFKGVKRAIVNGGAAGDITVTGIAAADQLAAVLQYVQGDITATATQGVDSNSDTQENPVVSVVGGEAQVSALADLTAEFTAAAGKINNTSGTNTTGSKLLVVWVDLT